MAIIDVKTEISGTVWKIEKNTGESVAEDDAILILESMKMEIPVPAPVSGTIRELLVREEETVTEGTVVARIEA